MKKIILTTLLFLIFTTSVFADTDKEILFRDIAWGSTFEDVKSTFKADNVSRIGKDKFVGYKAKYVLYDMFSETIKPTGLCHIAHISNPTFKVAGYDVRTIKMYFATTFDENTYGTDDVETSFYAAGYEFKFVDYEKTYKDLIEKLNSLYGDYSESHESGVISSYEWTGANDTACVLYLNSSWETINLNYAWYGGDKIMSEMSEVAQVILEKREDEVRSAADTDGL